MKARNREDKEKQAKTLIKAITMALKTPDEDFPTFILKKHLKGVTGYYDYSTITLAIFNEPIQTIIHEILHHLHPKWTETKVLQAERSIKHYITINEVVKILKLFVKHI